ncbi:type I phosphodiesterase / nucleotide pyrophosphatase family protein [Mycobacterium intracellulare 1956]|uniref:Type I phosphodiesterase / nucleotide pyrophosphatase family protein n=1 Tax=Mycobacterium intracellulare 1956 TaxID=1299331 RepID=X8CGT5_MYCIT|nr:type I phosphodiesterase / nucleotide pyrophosphatase family protein [Mycobacterium intracellulare 1956]
MPGSLRDVLPAAAALLGVPGAVDTLAVTERAGSDRIDRVLVVLVDGLGWHLLPQLAGGAPLLASVLGGATGRLTRLECTFPSTTPTSLVSLGTGAAPGEHGVLGFTLRVPGTETVLNHVRWRDDPSPAVWQPVPTWFQRLKEAGVSARAVLPALFLGSGLTEAAYRGAEFRPAGPADDYAQLVVDDLRSAPGLVYGYTAELDTAAHVFGVGSEQWHAAAASVDTLLSRLLEALPPNAALLVTADHGGLNVPPEARIDLDADARLARGVRVVAGEPGSATCTPSRAPRPTCGPRGPRCSAAGRPCTAASRRWAPGCSGRSPRRTWSGWATWWWSARATRRCWPARTSRRKPRA